MDRRPVPLWAFLLTGWLGARALHPGKPAFDEAWLGRAAAWPVAGDPEEMNARELRRLPGVGETRALALAKALLERGAEPGDGAFRWSSVRGVGPRTAERISRWRAEHAAGGAAEGVPDPGSGPGMTQIGLESESVLETLRLWAERARALARSGSGAIDPRKSP